MKRVLVLGGGFGGVAAALRLQERLAGEAEIVLIDRRTHFMVGFRKTWALVGEEPLAAGQRPLAALADKGINVIHANIDRILPDELAVEVDGSRMEAQALIVALGAALAPERVPGLGEHGLNVYAPEDIPRAAQALEAFPGGTVQVGVFGAPYKCPPAPYEIAIQVQDYLKGRGVEAEVEVFTPLPGSLPILGTAGCEAIEGRLAARGIHFLPHHRATAVEPGRVRFTTGVRPFDLLLTVPPHTAPAVVVESGLTSGGEWVPVDPKTLETRFPGVFAIGDVTTVPMANGKPLPMAGVFAQGEGEVVAERIAAAFRGQAPTATFKGEGGCFLEVGNGEAVMVEGHFLAEPAPQVRLTESSPAYLDQKRRFESERLSAWF